MRVRFMLAAALAAVACGLSVHPAGAQSADALAGQVGSAQEGAMEGVVVSAKKPGSIVTVSALATSRLNSAAA